MNAQEHVLTKSKRTYTDVETGHNARMYTSHDASRHHLIYEGNDTENLLAPANGIELKTGYYVAAHTGAMIKLNTGKKIYVNVGNFYKYKEGEKAVSRKFDGFDKFMKI